MEQKIHKTKTFLSEKILSRLKLVLKVNNDNELAVRLGVSKATVSNWKSRNSIDFPLVFSFCEHINLDWLIYGEGEMLKTICSSGGTPSDERPTLNDKGIKFPANNQGKTQENTSQQEYLINIIVEQAEEIGRLKARIEELERAKGDNAGHATSSAIADAG